MSKVTVAGKAFNVKFFTHTESHPTCHGCFFDDADDCPLEEGENACIDLPYGGQFVLDEDAQQDAQQDAV